MRIVSFSYLVHNYFFIIFCNSDTIWSKARFFQPMGRRRRPIGAGAGVGSFDMAKIRVGGIALEQVWPQIEKRKS